MLPSHPNGAREGDKNTYSQGIGPPWTTSSLRSLTVELCPYTINRRDIEHNNQLQSYCSMNVHRNRAEMSHNFFEVGFCAVNLCEYLVLTSEEFQSSWFNVAQKSFLRSLVVWKIKVFIGWPSPLHVSNLFSSRSPVTRHLNIWSKYYSISSLESRVWSLRVASTSKQHIDVEREHSYVYTFPRIFTAMSVM
jgi:hypothetical protein